MELEEAIKLGMLLVLLGLGVVSSIATIAFFVLGAVWLAKQLLIL